MKSKKIILLEKILKFMSVLVLKKYQPTVVAITGSVGKTTTKEAIYAILSNFIFARRSTKNFNNEIGVPLTILGMEGDTSKFSFWAKTFFAWLGLLVFPRKYPKVLILEMGAYYPGDIKYLCEIASPAVGVLTKIGLSHLERFKSQKNIIREKGQILRCLSKENLAVYNCDDENIVKIVEKISANSISFGFSPEAKMRASDVFLVYEKFSDVRGMERDKLRGISFKLNYQGKIIPVRLDHCVSVSYIYGALTAFAVGQYFNFNLVEMVQAIKQKFMLAGRMNLIDGIKDTMIIDDTYNSAPDSLELALSSVEKIRAVRKVVVLGDMLELGKEEEVSHQMLAKMIEKRKIDLAIFVGKRMAKQKEIFENILGKDKISFFKNPQEAGIFLQGLIRQGDLVLVKGSQGLRMEKVVEEVMARPEMKEQLLVRQDEGWRKTPFEEV